MYNYLVISGHDYRSRRRANVHFIADELTKSGNVRFFSCGFSSLSLIKGEPRAPLSSVANRVEISNGVECYLDFQALHPFNVRNERFNALTNFAFKKYFDHIPDILRRWIEECDFVIIESGLAIGYFDEIKRINPKAKTIYIASDELETINCAKYLINTLDRAFDQIDVVRVPSIHMMKRYHDRPNLRIIPHGFDRDEEEVGPSPYPRGTKNIISVGSMLFDFNFFEIASECFPDVNFHCIGALGNFHKMSGPNLHFYGEMKYKDTVPYIRSANAGVAPYIANGDISYLADTSLKLQQYGAYGIPAICPESVVGGKPGRFGYIQGDRGSIESAISRALSSANFSPLFPPTWAEVVQSLLGDLYGERPGYSPRALTGAPLK